MRPTGTYIHFACAPFSFDALLELFLFKLADDDTKMKPDEVVYMSHVPFDV